MLFVCHPKILPKLCLQFLLGVKMTPRETENNCDAKFRGDKQRPLGYIMVFSGVVNYSSLQFKSLEGESFSSFTTILSSFPIHLYFPDNLENDKKQTKKPL